MPDRARLRRTMGPVLAIAVAAFLVIVLLPAVRCFRAELSCFYPKRGLVPRPDDPALGAPSDVGFSSDGAELKGWYWPSRNGAGIVLVHGSGGDRASLLPEARILKGAGFGVLTFDMPGHGESGGSVRWGEPERGSVRQAVRWISQQPDLKEGRIGAFGFSMGGFILAQVAPAEPLIRAVVLAGAPSDAAAQTEWEYRHAGWLARKAALFADQWGGMSMNEPQPLETVSAIAPRPILFITGTRDETVPLSMVEELFRAANDPKSIYRVPDAGHGDYEKAAGAEYGTELLRFFNRSLLDEQGAAQ